jgi:PAS domain S-box-containing protein/putative nucleotidyltransferase with HDIG domain
VSVTRKTKQELLRELDALQRRLKELESSEAAGREARRETEENYRVLLEQSLEGIAIGQGLPPRFVFANRALGGMLGYTPDELTSLSPVEAARILHPDDRGVFFKRYRDRLRGRPATPRYEVRVIRRDGVLRWLELSSTRIRYRGRHALQATCVDVTERRQALEALQENEERYRALFSESRDALSITTRDGQYLDVNPAFLALFGYSREELVGVRAQELYADRDDRRRFQREIEQAGAVRDYPLRLRKKGGEEIDCLLTGTVRRDEAGEIIGYQGIVRDVSARRQAERRLAAIYALGKRLVLQHDESEIARMVVDTAWRVLAFPVCGLWLVNDEGNVLARAAQRSEVQSTELPPLPLNGDRGITVAVVRSGRPVYAPDVSKDPRYVSTGTGARSEACVPLRVGDRTVGALSAESRWLDGFDRADLRLLSALADRAAMAIANARLFAEVERSGRRYRTILETSADAIVSLDTDFVIDGWSSGAEQMLGYSRDEVIGASQSVLVPDGHHDAEDRVREVVRAQGYVRGWQATRRAKDGRLVDVELTMTELGSGLGYTVILRDITERKHAEHQLRLLKEFNESIVQSMAEGITVQDLHGRITFSNPAASALLGYAAEELAGMHWAALMPPEHHPTVEAADRRRAQGQSDRYELELVRRDGSRVRVLVSGSPRFQDGRLSGTMAVFTDITDIKQAEHTLQQTVGRLQRANESIVQAMTSIAEVRDPHTAGHQRRVAQLACAIAAELGLPGDQIEGIRMAALIHDIGKMYTPAEVLSKPGELSELELGLIKTHPQVGHDILSTVDFPWPIATIVLQHHEKMDGSGYPSGLVGDEILLEARILGVADVVEAMSSHRPYRPALGLDRAIEEIRQKRGTRYDPQVVDTCIALLTEKGFEFEQVVQAVEPLAR